MSSNRTEDSVIRLDSFNPATRRSALGALAAEALAGGAAPTRPEVNLHCHTFFSYNAYGYSPSHFAWKADRYGLEAAGIVDFDVLDGMAEFLDAGWLLKLKTTAGFESRVLVREYRDRVINSPHEPGVYYYVGTGFTRPPEPGTPAAETLTSMADCARRRNVRMADRINECLAPAVIDYEKDVLHLTPSGKATERHMLVAYERRAREVFPDEVRLAGFWGEKLSEPVEGVRTLLGDVVALKALIRTRLMKYGGVGYAPPGEGAFPPLEDVVAMTLDCGAVPSAAWLDGTSPGEADPVEHFRFMRDKGMPTVTIIPDRNWNLKDPDDKALKVKNLHAAIEAALSLDMPILVGTEMNKDGQKFVDTFSAPELAPHRQAFLDGAHVVWGHTLLKMTAGVGYTGPWADRWFDDNRTARNDFFKRIGRAPYPGEATMLRLTSAGADADPDSLLRILEP